MKQFRNFFGFRKKETFPSNVAEDLSFHVLTKARSRENDAEERDVRASCGCTVSVLSLVYPILGVLDHSMFIPCVLKLYQSAELLMNASTKDCPCGWLAAGSMPPEAVRPPGHPELIACPEAAAGADE